MTTILHFYPNGEFTQGQDVSKRRGKSRLEKSCDSLHTPGLSPVAKQKLCDDIKRLSPGRVEVGAKFVSPLGTAFEYVSEKREGGITLHGVNSHGEFIEVIDSRNIDQFVREEKYVPLVHQTLEFSQKQNPPRKKCLKMTSRMGRNIRNAAYIMEQEKGKDCLSFLTLTLPGLSPEDLHSCNTNWSALVDQFLKWLRSKIESKGGEFQYTYCTEVQPKRLKNRGEYALHLHMLFVGRVRRKCAWYVTAIQCRKAWSRCLRRYCAGSFEQSALENLQRIKKSAGGYLSKYLSKGKNGFSIPDLPTNEELPVIHWGGMSRGLSRGIRQGTRVFRGDGKNAEIAYALTRCIYGNASHRAFKFIKTSFISFDTTLSNPCSRGIWVAVGCLRGGMHTSILNDLIADITEPSMQSVCK